MFYLFTNYMMANRDGMWPQGKGPMTGAKMWSCSDAAYGDGKNVPFGQGKWKRCGKWMRRWMWSRWSSVAEGGEKTTNRGD